MTYDHFIKNIIDSRGQFGTVDGVYKEKHHIVPRCMGGSDAMDNIIYLYAKEHYIAHKLLAEEYPDNESLTYALWLMSIENGSKQILTPEEYESAKIRFIRAYSNALKMKYANNEVARKKLGDSQRGKKWFNNGVKQVMAFECPDGFVRGRLPRSAESIEKQRQSLMGNIPWNKGKTGIYSDETRKKMGAKNIGRTISEEHKQKLIASNLGNTRMKGRKLTEEHKRKISAGVKGKNVGEKNGMYGKIPWNKKYI